MPNASGSVYHGEAGSMDMGDVHILPIFLKFFLSRLLRETVLARLECISPDMPMEKKRSILMLSPSATERVSANSLLEK